MLVQLLLLAAMSSQAGSRERAQDEQVRPLRAALAVEPGSTCLDPEMVAPKVIAYFGQAEVDRRISVEIVGDPDDPRRVAFVVRTDGEVAAERAFDFPPETTCDEIHAVVSVAVALAIDATLLEQAEPPAEPEPPGPPEQDEEKPLQPPPARGPVPPVEAARRWSMFLGLEGGLSLGAPPPLGGFGGLQIEASWRRIIDIWVAGLGSSSGPREAGSGRAVLSVVGGGAGVCGGYRWRFVRPRGCVGAVAGAALATGQGFSDDRSSRVPWAAVVVGGDVRFAVTSVLELGLGADLLGHLVRPAFDFLDEAGRRRVGREFPPIGGLFSLQIAFRLR